MRLVGIGIGTAIVASIAAMGCRWNFDEKRAVDAAPPCEPVVDVTAISSGRDFSCALLAGGDVRCWGAGEVGQLGDGARTSRSEPVAPSGLAPATMISAGVQHACALVEGAVWCWGRNDAGQLGVGDRVSRDAPARVGSLPADVAGVTAGGAQSCAWTSAGELYCWGQTNGTDSVSVRPVRVLGVPAIAKATAGTREFFGSAGHVCAIGTDGSTWCWGSNSAGELGIDDPLITSSPTAVRVATPLAFVDIAAGMAHTCGRTEDGVVACWGINADGEIGDGTTTDRFAPVVVSVAPSVEIAANEETTCSRDRAGTVSCWGDNDREQLGRTGDDALVPEVIAIPAARSLGIGESHSCSIGQDGVVTCWGADRAGQRRGVLDAEVVVIDADADWIAAGGDTTCALSSGRMHCWGFGALGQLGDGTRASRPAPMDVGLANVTQISVGYLHACARRGDASIACWGANEDGRVLFAGEPSYTTPQVVGGIGIAPTSVAAGGGHTCSVGATGVPWCWGNSDEGTLGQPSQAEGTSAPVASRFANATSVSVGRNHTCIVTSTNQVWCSGRNNEAQIGRPDNNPDVYDPLEVTGAPSAAMVSAGGLHTCAISTTGGGWCWGDNVTQQIGDGSEQRATAPTALSITGLVEIAAGTGHTCARDATTVWCWGANTSGQLGDGTFTTRGSPTVATGFAGAVQLALGANHTCVRMADRTVRCAGSRTYGQTGAGTVLGPAPTRSRLTCP